VSPNPLHRNPSYEPLQNPDRLIRNNELQYVVWDSFSADRSPFFARAVRRFADRYNGRAVHTETVTVKSADGRNVERPLITVYEVRPS
jgi:argonaute-like protein implicated in RNA metabolism and viral defense